MFSQETTPVDNVQILMSRLAAALDKKTNRRGNSKDYSKMTRRPDQKVIFARIDPDKKEMLENFLFKYKLNYKDWLMSMISKNCHI